MKTAFALLVVNIPSLVCVAAAAFLAANRLNGWGWFLFVGAIMAHSIKGKDDGE